MSNEAEGAGRTTTSSPDPFAKLSRFEELRKASDELAAEFWAKRKPLRSALDSIPSEDPEQWHEVGKQLRNAGLASFPTEMADSSPVDAVPTSEQVARWTAWALLSAAATGNRSRVSELLANVAKRVDVKESLAQVIYRVQEDCLAKWRIHTSPPYIARTKELLSELDISLDAATEWLRTGRTELATGTQSALWDWFRSIGLGQPIALVHSESDASGSLYAYLDERDREKLERLRTELTELPGLVDELNRYHRILSQLNPSRPDDVRVVLGIWTCCLNAKAQSERLNDSLHHSHYILSPKGSHARTAADLLETNTWQASNLVFASDALVKECTAFTSAAARQRGIIGAGATLSDDAIRELTFAVRPADESAPSGSVAAALPTPPAEAEKNEGENPQPDASNDAPAGPAKPRIPRDEAERLVAAAIANTPLGQRDKLSVRALNRITGVSVGMISGLDSWQKLQDEKVGSVRSVPLTDALHAVLNNPTADAADPAEAAADAEVLSELLELADTNADCLRYESMTPGERWQMLELLKDQNADARRDQRRPRRERPDCS